MRGIEVVGAAEGRGRVVAIDVESAAEGYRQDGGGYIDKADTGRISSLLPRFIHEV